jgi:hypothetical protein
VAELQSAHFRRRCGSQAYGVRGAGWFRIGVEFVGMPQSSRRILANLLERLANPLFEAAS